MDCSDDISFPTGRTSNLDKEYENTDCWRYAAEQFRELWETKKVFNPDNPFPYGINSEKFSIHFFDNARLLNASFGTFPLGFSSEVGKERANHQGMRRDQKPETELGMEIVSTRLWQEMGDRSLFQGNLHPGLSLLDPIINDTFSESYIPLQPATNRSKSFREDLCRLWRTLQESPTWVKSMCGVVTVPHWGTTALRDRIRQQLQLAAFMGFFAVQIPLPLLDDEDEPQCVAKTHEGHARSSQGRSLTEARNWALLGHVRDELVSFIQAANGVKIWVRCDACKPEHLAQYHRMHQLVLYGYECDPVSKEAIGPRRCVTANSATEILCREAITSLMPMLYFSETQGSIISAWLGEDVGVFEPPHAGQLYRLLPPNQKAGDTKDYALRSQSSMRFDSYGSQNSYSIGIVSSRDEHRRFENCGSGSDKKDEASQGDETPCHVDPSIHWTGGRVSEKSVLQDDLLPRDTARWGGLYSRNVSLITFLVELMRRRAVPLFSLPLFEDYSIMSYLYSREVVDPTRDPFGNYEDTLQLPLQPLSQLLPNAVYHIFECDSTKYSRYRDAVLLFLRDWSSRDPAVFHHGRLNSGFISSIVTGVGNDREAAVERAVNTVYVVLLGCGRGGIVDEIISAASTLGLRLRLFAIEKNQPAAELTRLRWLCDPEWRHQAAAFDHTLAVIVGDGRHLFEGPGNNGTGTELVQLPDDFGLCDLLVSEMLGSFGDNELSPECIDTFHNQLLQLQAVKGIIPNKHFVSIPQSYTTWVAPLRSTRIEQCLFDTAIRGLTVCPEYCTNRHVALFSSPMVSNITRGVLLDSPQACWCFSHFFSLDPEAGGEDRGAPAGCHPYERHCTLRFNIPEDTRCSGMVGFFSCVLYHSELDGEEVCISTEPRSRTPGMYSWFPGYLALDPSYQLQNLDRTGEFVFSFRRHVEETKRRVWYSWEIEGNSDSTRCNNVVGNSTDRERIPEGVTIQPLNEGGWAASMLL